MKTKTINRITNEHIETKARIRVLIADDMPRVRQGLRSVLKLVTRNTSLQIDIVGEAGDGKEAIEQTQTHQPDAVIMDLEMPNEDGFVATQWIKSAYPDIGVIILTIHSDQLTRQKATQAGADAFVEKGTPIEILIQALQKFGKKT